MLINNNTLLRYARDPAYSWMQSLSPLRVEMQKGQKRGCCGHARAQKTPTEVFDRIGANAVFKAEIQQLKKRLNDKTLTIAVGRHRFLV